MVREYDNHMKITFDSISENEKFARIVVAAFIARLNPTMEEMSDVTGNPCVVQTFGATPEAMVKYLEFVGDICDKPFLIDSTAASAKIPCAFSNRRSIIFIPSTSFSGSSIILR